MSKSTTITTITRINITCHTSRSTFTTLILTSTSTTIFSTYPGSTTILTVERSVSKSTQSTQFTITSTTTIVTSKTIFEELCDVHSTAQPMYVSRKETEKSKKQNTD